MLKRRHDRFERKSSQDSSSQQAPSAARKARWDALDPGDEAWERRLGQQSKSQASTEDVCSLVLDMNYKIH